MAKFLVNQTDLFDNGQNKPYMEFRDTVIVTVYPDSSKKYTSYWLSHDTLYNKPNEYYIYLLKGDTLQMNRPEKAIEMTLVRVK